VPSRSRAVAIAATVVALALSGCAQGSDTTTGTPPSTVGPGGAPPSTASPDDVGDLGGGIGAATRGSSTGTTVAVSGTVTYEGYRVTVADGSYTSEDHELRIPLAVENLGPSDATFYGDAIALVGGTSEPIVGNLSSPPTIPPGATAHVAIAFSLGDGLDGLAQDTTVLTMGDEDHQQARVPFGGAGDVLTLDPIEQDLPNLVTVGTVTIAPTRVELRYDDVVDHTQAAKGTAYLVLSGKVSNASTDSTAYLGTDEASIALPDGSSGPPDSFTSADPSIAPSATTDFRLRWTVAATVTGDCTITFAANWGVDGAKVSGPMRVAVRAS
jgi:hypothetical protein